MQDSERDRARQWDAGKESLVEAGRRSMQGVGTTDASPEKEKMVSAD